MAENVEISVGMTDAGAVRTVEDLAKAQTALNQEQIVSENATKRRLAEQEKELDQARKRLALAKQEIDGIKAKTAAEREAASAAKTAADTQRKYENFGGGIAAAGQAAQHNMVASILRSNNADIARILDARLSRETRMTNEREARGIAGADSAGGGIGDKIASAIGGVSLVGAITKLVSFLEDNRNALNSQGIVAERNSRGLIDFQQMNVNAGPAGVAFVKETLDSAAARGISSADVGIMANPIQSSVEASETGLPTEKGMATFKEGMSVAQSLVNLGTGAQDAGLVISQGIEKGVAPTRMGNIFQTTATLSKMSSAQVGAAAPGTNFFSSPEAGFASIAALSTMESPDRIREATESLQKAIGPGAVDTKFVKKFGLKGLNEEEALAQLRQKALTYTERIAGEGDDEYEKRSVKKQADELKKYGLEDREAKSVGIAMQKFDVFQNAMRSFEALPSDVDISKQRFEKVVESFPGTASEFKTRKGAATFQAKQMNDPEALAERERRRVEGEYFQSIDANAFVDPQTGESDWGGGIVGSLTKPVVKALGSPAFKVQNWARKRRGEELIDNPFTDEREGPLVRAGRRSAYASDAEPGAAMDSGPAGGGTTAELARLNGNIEQLNTRLEMNTQATEKNTSNTEASTISPGAPLGRVNRGGNT